MLITLKDIKTILAGNVLFENLSFDIQAGDKIGLVGRNGTGKTTIFKLITQMESMDDGQLYIKKNTKIGYLAQIPQIEEKTVYEFLRNSFAELMDIQQSMSQLEAKMQDPDYMEKAIEEYGKLQEEFMRLGGYEIESQIDKVAHGLHIHTLLQHSFDQLSGGEKTKVGLARILLESPDVLLLDEPTNHLDIEAIEWLEEHLKQYEGAVCIISHDRHFLDRVVTKVADLEQGEIELYQGNYSSYVQQKEEKLLAEFKAYQEQQKRIKKMKEAIKRLRQWANEANPPSEKLFRKAKSMEKALEKMETVEKPVLDPKRMDLSLSSEERSGTDVIVAENVAKYYDGKPVLKGLDLHLRYKERLAVIGKNGAGKTTLLNLLLNKEKPTDGFVKVGTSIHLGYLPQEPLFEVDPTLRMIDYFREEVRVTEGQARQILAKFMFFGYAVFRKIHQLSGGEQMRVKLAIFMHQNVNLLILDEPTNHLDIDSQEVLEDAINQFSGTVICVSHDRYFLNKCFSETAYLEDGKLYRYKGSYDETKHKLMALREQKEESMHDTSKKGSFSKQAKKKETTRDYEQEIQSLEKKINDTKEEMVHMADVEELMNAQEESNRLEKELEELYEKWLLEE
ncbi:ABC-F type ribosomal protection protein [Pontibacillus yanchengensis]|uniref:ABC-F type ribosomal protection protein n=1 Tax=Pontibacillus yanchengensis TaxID=462910 RepID=A0ACC7VKK3_9BACI|nr:ABC-F type ribosomal protection protein [Pontibacillus yanchengensis]MYL55222.1 ABC-F type ribosomal protection protein [Pontibacillus yanchengensis]